jgi:uncharacterized membrane protein
MSKARLEAFSDGVIAILITIMMLELKVPQSSEWSALVPLTPVIITYVLSFVYLGIYWNNHHHMLHATHHVTGGILWANLHLLFWLSLIPATTEWIDQTHYAPAPTAVYGAVLFMSGLAYSMLQARIIRSQGADSVLRRAVQKDWKGKLSLVFYTVAAIVSLRFPLVAASIYGLVALMWLVPDRRIEQALIETPG